MKRLLLILLTLLYTGAVSGATFHLHFCGQSLQIISFGGLGHDECCCADDAPKKENCCTDKTVSVKVNENHTSSESHFVPANTFQLIPAIAVSSQLIQRVVHAGYVDVSHPPPPNDGASPNSLLVMHCIFRV